MTLVPEVAFVLCVIGVLWHAVLVAYVWFVSPTAAYDASHEPSDDAYDYTVHELNDTDE
jgi:hypothetical protein